MGKLTMDQLHTVISKPDSECDGWEIHLKRLWENNNAKSIFSLTGLDVDHLLTGPKKDVFEFNTPSSMTILPPPV